MKLTLTRSCRPSLLPSTIVPSSPLLPLRFTTIYNENIAHITSTTTLICSPSNPSNPHATSKLNLLSNRGNFYFSQRSTWTVEILGRNRNSEDIRETIPKWSIARAYSSQDKRTTTARNVVEFRPRAVNFTKRRSERSIFSFLLKADRPYRPIKRTPSRRLY